MSIETLEDWNAILGQCCCPMPSCPVPVRRCESISGRVELAFDVYFSVEDIFHRTTRWDYSGGGFRQWRKDGLYDIVVGSVYVVVAETIVTEDDPRTGSITVSYPEPIDVDAARGGAPAALAAAIDWDDEDLSVGTECVSSGQDFDPSADVSRRLLEATVCRWRWEIAREHEGSWFRIVWDEVFFPEDEAAEPVVREQDRSWEWTGPGDPEDDGSWRSEWYELAAPEAAGEVRVVNVRFECYRAERFGNKPQVTGEGYEIPEE
jgi:hypothetical protein